MELVKRTTVKLPLFILLAISFVMNLNVAFSQEKIKAGYPANAATKPAAPSPEVNLFSKPGQLISVEKNMNAMVPDSYRNHPEFGKIKLKESPQSVELIQERTANSRTFINPDGTFTKTQSSGILHYKNGNGEWISLEQSPSANSRMIGEFGITATDKPILVNSKTGICRMVLDQQNAIEFTNEASMEITDASGKIISANTKNKTDGSPNGSDINFSNYWNNTDRVQSIHMDRVKLNYIIKSLPSGIPSNGYVVFKEKLKVPSSWQIRKSGAGEEKSNQWFGILEVINESGQKIGTFENLVYFDEGNDSEIQGGYMLEKSAEGYIISTVVPAQWLTSPSRVFPVTIDPTLTNTYSSGNIGSSYNTECVVNMNVTIPANSTVSSTLIESTYQASGNTKKRNARISYTGPGGTIGEYYCNENANGACNLSNTSTTIANGFYATGVVPFSIGVKRNTNSGASCNTNNLYVANNSWDITLTYTTCTVPTAGGTVTGPASASCGQSIEYSCAGGSGSYQWQYSTNGGTSYTSITGATSSSLSLSFNSANTYKIRVIRSSSNCQDSYSSTINTVVTAGSTGQSTSNPFVVPSLPYSGTHATYCYTAGYSGTNNQLTLAKFFRFTTGPCASTINISTCNQYSNFDTYIHLLNSSGTQLTSNDDMSGCTYTMSGNQFFSQIANYSVSPNTVYYVVVQAYRYASPASGIFGLDISEGSGSTIAPSVSITGNGPVCENGNVILQAIPVNGGSTPSYLWKKNGQTTGVTTSTFSSSNLSNGDAITVTMTSSNACASPSTAVSTAYNVVIASGSPITTSSNSPLCDGSDLILNASVSGTPASFSWSGPNGFTSSQQNPIISNGTSANSGTYTVTVINEFGCSSTNTAQAVIASPMSSTVSNFTNPGCIGQTNGSIQIAVSGGTQPYGYMWSDGSSTATASNLTEGTYAVTVFDANGCTSYTEQTLTASAPVSAADAGTNQELCNQLSISLNAASPTSGTGIWSVVSGSGTFADASSPATTVSNLSTSQPNIFKWTVSNGCNSSNDEIQISVFTAPPANQPVTTGPITGCKGDTLHYVTNLVAPTLVWEARPEGEIISGQGTQNVTIIFGNTTSTGYHACVTGTNACGTSRAKCVAIRSNSSTPSFRLAPVDVCDGSTVVYKCNNVAGAVRYRWSAPANILINGNQSPYITTDTSVSIYFPTGFGSAKIAVAASAGCDFGVNRELNVSSTPLVPYAITGAKADLCNTLQTYSIRSREHQTYRWTLPAGATIQYTSPTTDTIKVLFGSSVTGNIIVVAQNSCGNNSLERKLAVTSFPPTPGIITGPTDVCPNTGGYAYSVAAVPNATSYQWTLPAGATITSGAGTNSIEVQYANAINKVSVQAIGSCGTSAKRNLTIVSNCRVVNQPEKSKDVISQPSATAAVEFNLQAYPDAQSKVLTVTFNAAKEGVYEYKIFNEADTEVKSGEIDAVNGSNMEQIDMSALPNATYRIVLENETVSHQLNVRFF